MSVINLEDIAVKDFFVQKNEEGEITKIIFPHPVKVGLNDNSHFNATISGSIHHTHEGLSYLVAGNGIAISSGSNGQITITGNIGDITAVTAGSGLTGGGESGDVTLNIGSGIGITVNANDIEIDADGGALTTSNSDIDQILINDGGVFKRIAPSNINISGFNNDSGFTANTGDITGVTAGTGLSGGGSSGPVSLNLDFSELTDMTGDIAGTTEFILQDGTTESRKAASEIKLSNFNNDIIAGSNTQVQFNDNGSFGASSALTFSGTELELHANSPTVTFRRTNDNQNSTINFEGSGGVTGASIIFSGSSSNDLVLSTFTSSTLKERVRITSNTDDIAVDVTGSLRASLGLSGSLTKLSDGKSYLVEGDNITITSASNGQVTIASTGVSIANDSNNRVITATGANSLNGEANLTFDGTDLFVNGKVKTTGLEFTDGDDALTISNSGYLTIEEGILNSYSIKVNSTHTTGANKWLKIAEGNQPEPNDTAATTFLIRFSGLEFSTTYSGDANFIVTTKFTYKSSSPYYWTLGTYVTVEPLHSLDLNGFDPESHLAITFDNSGTWQLWIQSRRGYKDCYVSILGGTREASGVSDPGAVIQTGQTFQSSITSLGTEVYGQYATKTFGEIDIFGNSINPLFTIDNAATDDSEYIRATASGETDPDQGCILIEWRDSGSDTLYKVQGNATGGSQVSTSFTAGHDTIVSGSVNVVPGMIVESSGEVWYKPTDKTYETALPKCQIAESNGSKKVFGVISGYPVRADSDGNELIREEEKPYIQNGFVMPPSFSRYGQIAGIDEGWWNVSTMSIGEGVIWITNINGEIENGDLIESSEIPGYGRLQSDDIIRSKTVAKCTEDINWESITDVLTYNGQEYKKYLASCTFHCG